MHRLNSPDKSLLTLLYPIFSYPSFKNRFNDILPFLATQKKMILAVVRNTQGNIYVEIMRSQYVCFIFFLMRKDRRTEEDEVKEDTRDRKLYSYFIQSENHGP